MGATDDGILGRLEDTVDTDLKRHLDALRSKPIELASLVRKTLPRLEGEEKLELDALSDVEKRLLLTALEDRASARAERHLGSGNTWGR